MAKNSALRSGAGGYAKVLHMANGGAVSPYSLRGMANSIGSMASSVAAPFRTPAGYTPAAVAAPAPAATPAAAPAPAVQLGGLNMGAMQRREAAAGLRDGGAVRGKGGPTQDNIPIMGSVGEHMLPADTVQALGGHAAIDRVIDATHTPAPAKKSLRGNGYANGGAISGLQVTEDPSMTEEEARAYAAHAGRPGTGGIEVTENPAMSAEELAGFHASPAGAEAAHGARVNPAPAPSEFQSTGYQDHFGGAPVGDPAVPAANAAETAGSPGVAARGLRAVGGTLARGGSTLLRGAGAIGIGTGAYNATKAAMDGDATGAALGAGDAAASAALLSGVGTIPALGYTALRGGYEAGQSLPDKTREAIGGTINSVLRRFGGGVNDDALNTLNAQQPTPSTAAPSAPAVAPLTDVQRGGNPGPYVPPANDVTQVGNEFSGANISGTPTINGSALRSGGFVGGTGDGTFRYGGGSSDNSEALTAARAAAIDRGDIGAVSDSYGAQGQSFAGGRYAPQTGLRAQLAGKTLTRAGAAALAEQDRIDAQRETSRATTAVALRGQDVTERGQDIQAGTARLQGRLQQMQNDRTYQLDVARLGQEQAKTNFEQREKSIKDVHEEFAGMLPHIPGPDGKTLVPDTATAARYSTALVAHLGSVQADLEQRAARGDTKAAGALKELQTKGLGALDAKDKQRFFAGMQAADAAQQNSTGAFNPVGGRAVIDPRPISGLRKTSNGFLGFGGEYTSDRGDTIPARVIERDGSYIGGLRNRSYEPLIRK